MISQELQKKIDRGVKTTPAFNLLKDTHIKLKGVGGGWSCVDYDCTLALDYVD